MRLQPAAHILSYLGVMGELGRVVLLMAASVFEILALAGFGALIAKRVSVEDRVLGR